MGNFCGPKLVRDGFVDRYFDDAGIHRAALCFFLPFCSRWSVSVVGRKSTLTSRSPLALAFGPDGLLTSSMMVPHATGNVGFALNFLTFAHR